MANNMILRLLFAVFVALINVSVACSREPAGKAPVCGPSHLLRAENADQLYAQGLQQAVSGEGVERRSGAGC